MAALDWIRKNAKQFDQYEIDVDGKKFTATWYAFSVSAASIARISTNALTPAPSTQRRREMKKQESYWSFQAPDTPELADLPEGVFAGGEQGWASLSPGYRRTIWREAKKRLEREGTAIAEDTARQRRADDLHRKSEVQITAREAL